MGVLCLLSELPKPNFAPIMPFFLKRLVFPPYLAEIPKIINKTKVYRILLKIAFATAPHRFKARTAASDGQHAITRAARSAGLRFAVRSLSQAKDRETAKSGARVGPSSTAKRSPFPS